MQADAIVATNHKKGDERGPEQTSQDDFVLWRYHGVELGLSFC